MADHSSKERIPGVPRYRKPKDMPHDGTEPFFPNFLLKEWIVGAIFLVAFIVWIIYNPVHLEERADPSATGFIPVPDWYFLFLYQLLKYIPGQLIWLGTVVIPGLAMTLLALVPWLDRRKARHPYKRVIPTTAMVLSMIFMGWLTYEATEQHHEAVAKQPPKSTVKDTKLVDAEDAGAKVFQANCATCHGADLKGKVGPALLGAGNHLDAKAIEDIIANGKGGKMPPNVVQGDDAKKVAEWVAKQKQK